jgi:hypothetical protein
MAEDATDLRDIEREIDDQMAGKRVTQVVETKRRPAAVFQAGSCAA